MTAKGMKFNAEHTTQKLIEWIRNWFEQNGKNCNAVIGISSGKDSTVVAALCVKALGKDRVLGVLMPNGIQCDITDSYNVCNELGIHSIEVNIRNIYESVLKAINSEGIADENGKYKCHLSLSEQTRLNLTPRLRMATLYAIAQSCNGRVSCNSNLSEKFLGWCTRWADNIGDFAPLSNLTSDEVIEIGDYLGLPKYLIHKDPSDGLTGKTDEDNFGFSYEVLNNYIRQGVCEDEEIKKKIDVLHEKNMFKLMPMPCFSPSIDCFI